MKKNLVDGYRQAASELRRYFKSGRYRKMRPERAFVDWYIEARFGKPDSKMIVDGKKDGGLDAIIKNNGITYVLQSKYETKPRVSSVTRSEVAAFDNLVGKFRDEARTPEFISWLATVRSELKAEYNKVRESTLARPNETRFIFVTTKKSEYGDGDVDTYSVETIQHIAALWYLYSEGFTPPIEHIDLNLDSSWHTDSDESGYTTYVGLAEVLDFLRPMSHDKSDRLFAQNVRTNLGSKINEKIRETYESEPENFWLGNNGIYVICRDVVARGNNHKLLYPSVINGSQTLHAIAESKKRHHCRILVRILKMDISSDIALLDVVVRRTNSQNKMNLVNLFAHDNCQLNVARYLDKYQIFYERREREWKNERRIFMPDYVHVNVKDVAQWLSTIDDQIGFGEARSQLADLFEKVAYQRLFGQFDPQLSSSAYERLSILIWCGLFANNVVRHMEYRIRPFAKISRLLIIRAIYESVMMTRTLQNQVQWSLENHLFGKQHVDGHVLKEIRGMVRKMIVLQKAVQVRDPSVDYSNFFKRDELTSTAFEKCCSQSVIRRLSKNLERSIGKII